MALYGAWAGALGKSVACDIFVAGELLSKDPLQRNGDFDLYKNCKDDCIDICDEIADKNFRFDKVDAAIDNICGSGSQVRFKMEDPNKMYLISKYDKLDVAEVLVKMIAAKKLYWDDISSHRTTMEMEQYKKTLFGRLLFEYGCFESQRGAIDKAIKLAQQQQNDPDATANTVRQYSYHTDGDGIKRSQTIGTNKNIADKRRSTNTNTSVLKGFRDTGPRSQDCASITNPNAKVSLNLPLYHIEATVTKRNLAYPGMVFVDPLSGKNKANTVSTISIGTPNGYSASPLFFASLQEASDALDKLLNNTNIVAKSTKYSNFEAVRSNLDSGAAWKHFDNGFFEVNTIIGKGYIYADQLNEEIKPGLLQDDPILGKCIKRLPDGDSEVIEELKPQQKAKPKKESSWKNFKINDIETYMENIAKD